MTVPNILTSARFLLAGIGCAALILPFPFHVTLATIIFVVAAITDYADGMLARRWNLLSNFGTFMDPLADKLLVFLYFTHFTVIGVYPEWLFLIVLARDLILDGYRNFAAAKQVIIGANIWSKIKTTLQMLSLIACLVTFTLPEMMGMYSSAWGIGFTIAVWSMAASFVCGLLGSMKFITQYTHLLTSGE